MVTAYKSCVYSLFPPASSGPKDSVNGRLCKALSVVSPSLHQTQTSPGTLRWRRGTAAAYLWPGTVLRTASSPSSSSPPSTSMEQTMSQRRCPCGTRGATSCSSCRTCSPAPGLGSACRQFARPGWSPATARWSWTMETPVSPAQVKSLAHWTISIWTSYRPMTEVNCPF